MFTRSLNMPKACEETFRIFLSVFQSFLLFLFVLFFTCFQMDFYPHLHLISGESLHLNDASFSLNL